MFGEKIDAIYENGVLRPLVPVNLAEHQQVSIVIRLKGEEDEDEEDESEYMPFVAEDGDPNITWEEVHKATENIPGSLADQIIRDRDERF